MGKIILVITLVSAVLLLTTCAKRKEGYCRLKNQKVDISKPTIYYASQYQSKLSEKTDQFKDLPQKISNRVNYFLTKINGREIPMIIDRGNESQLYLDTDADGRLSDEKGFAYKAIKEHLFGPVDYHRFGPISLKFEQAAGKCTQQIYIFTRDSYMRRLILCPAVCRKGKVLLDNNIYEVMVIDGNYDGKYDKFFTTSIKRIGRPGCDSFAIDLNRNRKLDFNYYHKSELMPLGRMLKVGNSYYAIKVDESGESLELNKIQPDYGMLDLGDVNVKMKLWSDTAEQYFSNLNSNVKIPAGKYQALFIELSQVDPVTNAWNFTCYRDTGSLKNFEITKDQTTSIKIGPPFQVKTTARRNKDTVVIGCTLVGQAGEKYRPDSRIKRNGRRVSPPIVRIIDEQGGELEAGRLKYG